jgi:hypothetical protein
LGKKRNVVPSSCNGPARAWLVGGVMECVWVWVPVIIIIARVATCFELQLAVVYIYIYISQAMGLQQHRHNKCMPWQARQAFQKPPGVHKLKKGCVRPMQSMQRHGANRSNTDCCPPSESSPIRTHGFHAAAAAATMHADQTF